MGWREEYGEAPSLYGKKAPRPEEDVPFKSKAQRRKFAELLVKGKITPDTFEEWNRETGTAKLPERVKRKAKSKAATKRTTRKKSKTKRKTRVKRRAR